MKKTIARCLLCLFIILANAASAQENSLLWKISGKGLPESSYLFGTIHVMPKSEFSISPRIQKAFENSSALALEVGLKMGIAKQVKIAKMALLPQGKTLEDYLSQEDYNLVKSHCLDSLKIPESKFNTYVRMKPFFFSAAIEQEKMGETASYEIELDKLARQQRKKRLGLESIEFQMETIDKISIQDQAKMLVKEFGGNAAFQFKDMLDMYQREDLNGLHKALSEVSMEIPEFNHYFLSVRNSNWIPVIEKQIAQKPTFIAVGAAHLPGENGVIELLRKKGYTVEPVLF
ncbi:MAG: hypothetical protein RI973_689 [Bacteroidota bacterium]|jgi:uncharacterized protein YbaP (TraB family)